MTDNPANPFREFIASDDTMRIRIGPVADVREFAKKLEFLNVILVDEPNRTITAEVKE